MQRKGVAETGIVKEMGKLITFWSPYAGRAKVTSVMCAVAGAFGILYPNTELALSHVIPETMDLESRMDDRIGGRERRSLYETSGLAALELQYMQSVLTSEKIRRCAIPMLMKSLYLFPGAIKKGATEELRHQLLTERLAQEFSYTFLDLGSGRTESNFRLMEAADVVVVVLPQQPENRERLRLMLSGIPKAKEVCMIIGGYMKNSRYSEEGLKRKKEYAEVGKIIGVIPMNAGYMDAMAEGRTLEFFLRNELVKKKEDNYEFIYQAKRATEQLKKLADKEGRRQFLLGVKGTGTEYVE